MKILPKGVTKFTEIIDQSKYFVDTTSYIEKLDNSGENFLFFVRPRRFGKSVFIDMLEAYYDIARKDKFEHYFRNTWIYDHVTEEQGKYQVINLDFSNISGDIDTVEFDFNDLVGRAILRQAKKYSSFYSNDFISEIASISTAKNRLEHFCAEARVKGYPVYLLVDEYDNLVKSGFQKIFMTGVTPVTLDDLTSGFNIATNITLDPNYNGMMGFSETEVRKIIEYYKKEGTLSEFDTEEIISCMAPWYDNYCFSKNAFDHHEHVYNSYMVTTCLLALIKKGEFPEGMMVPNSLIDYEKLKWIAELDHTFAQTSDIRNETIEDIILGKVSPAPISESFPAEEITDDNNFLSYLFYLGMLTVTGKDLGMPVLGIPNSIVRQKYYEYLRRNCSDKVDRGLVPKMGKLITGAARDGSIRPLTEAVTEAYAKYSGNRQLKMREGLFQAFFLAFMASNDVYEQAPEIEMNHGYSDIFLFPKKDNGIRHSYLIELKYLETDSTEHKKEEALHAAREQLERYVKDPIAQKLSRNTALHKVVVIIRGFKLELFEDEIA